MMLPPPAASGAGYCRRRADAAMLATRHRRFLI
jgi:hypothetical protein